MSAKTLFLNDVRTKAQKALRISHSDLNMFLNRLVIELEGQEENTREILEEIDVALGEMLYDELRSENVIVALYANRDVVFKYLVDNDPQMMEELKEYID